MTMSDLTVFCDVGSMPDSALSRDMMRPQYSLTNVPTTGGYSDVRDRIRPASIPSACDVASSVDCSLSLRDRRRNSTYVKAIIADSLASGPFEDFLLKRDCRKAQLLLNFWRDAQVRDELVS